MGPLRPAAVIVRSCSVVRRKKERQHHLDFEAVDMYLHTKLNACALLYSIKSIY